MSKRQHSFKLMLSYHKNHAKKLIYWLLLYLKQVF